MYPISNAANYTKLRDLLKAGNWKEADEETLRVMCQVAKREKEGWLRIEDIKQFPCADLKAIDQLWVKYSDGKFGFSIQKKIWQECGSPMDDKDDWETFRNRVGWRKKGDWVYDFDLIFSTEAPVAHLPVLASEEFRCGVFFSRVKTCRL
jgi:eukaryotic-like serine/threonine-protein kinase